MLSPVAATVDRDRKELLDLTLRNPLLNFRPLKARGVEITDELPTEIYRLLVVEGKGMTFLPKPEPRGETDASQNEEGDSKEAPRVAGEEGGDTERRDEADETPEESEVDSALSFAQPALEEEEENEGIAARHLDSKLQTIHTDTRLQRLLLNTFYLSRATIEELGVNTLYLALGGLRWVHPNSADTERRAPLILVPVELSRGSVRSRFRISYTGDDIGTNLSLRYKLQADFGLRLPAIEAEEDLDVSAYFDQVAELTEDREGWSVDREMVQLAFFSFTKLMMYEDLDPESWTDDRALGRHPLLPGLLGSGLEVDAEQLLPDDTDLDTHLAPGASRHVWEADSSQTLAIADVLRGSNLVIQGPPGTGKSQTITNLIAELVAAGKTVLFVAEKLAALEVVKRRLDAAGIGAACLELHSRHSQRRAILEDLEKTMRLGRPHAQQAADQARELRDARDRLSAYAEQLNAPVSPSRLTPHRAVARLLRLDRELANTDPPGLSIPDAVSWSDEEHSRRVQAAADVETLLQRIGPPSEHAFWGSHHRRVMPHDIEEVKSRSSDIPARIDVLLESGRAVARLLGEESPSTLQEAQNLHVTSLQILDAPDLSGLRISSTDWPERVDSLVALFDLGERLDQLHAKHKGSLLPEAWEEDLLAERKILGSVGRKWWRFFSGEYRRAARRVEQLYREAPPKELDERLVVVDAILESKRIRRDIEAAEAGGTTLLGSRWQGTNSDWAALRRATIYLAALHRDRSAGKGSKRIFDLLTDAELDLEALRRESDRLRRRAEEVEKALKSLTKILDLDVKKRWGVDGVEEAPLAVWRESAEVWSAESPTLRDLANFNSLAGVLKDLGLAEPAAVGESWPGAALHLSALIERERYRALLGKAIDERAALRDFVQDTHELTLERFRRLDRDLVDINRHLVAEAHHKRIPRHNTAGQMGTLLREIEKKRRHKPVRRLLQEAGEAIQAIKPVFMMSPLSVAAYLAPDGPAFDVVIFDEASQVRPVDAYGAILRGRQAIVVGDSRQLPPTSFFDRISGDDGDPDEDRAGDLESVLGLFASQGAPQKMLRWHYRSRHDSLIAVSNLEFYEKRLVVTPSPERETGRLGLVYRYLPDAHYESGKRGGINPGEAGSVAEAVLEHARRHPEKTLGVAAFSQRQAQEILDQLELLRREDPSHEEFFLSHPEEPFFVKNLENVQGDERDVIFISIGYGWTRDGVFRHSFGPLNYEGGERRLNVLITRARERCEVFTNLRSEDIDLDKTRARGVAALKTFLHFAEHGRLARDEDEGEAARGEVADEVADRLREVGWEAVTRVGSNGSVVDVAVRDPKQPGRFVLAVLCDGESYAHAAWARDRDRLREEVLTSQGWKVHRVWSMDWYHDPERQLTEVVRAAEEAAAQRQEPEPIPDSVARRPPPVSRSQEREAIVEDMCGVPYKEAVVVVDTGGVDLHTVDPAKMARWVARVVYVESPVHLDEVAGIIAAAAGTRAGKRIRTAVEAGAEVARQQGELDRDGDFLFVPDREVVVRDRSSLPAQRRKIDLIAGSEIAAGLLKIIRESCGIDRDGAIQSCCRLLGFARTGTQISERISEELDALYNARRIRRRGELLVLPG